MCEPLKKPKMRGLLAAQLRIHVPVAVTLAFSAGAAYKVFVVDARQRKIRDYYLDYDPQVSLEYMSKHMQSSGNWKPGA